MSIEKNRPGIPLEPEFVRNMREKLQPPSEKNVAFASVISRRFSIYFTMVFLKLKTHPDNITLMMIVAGIASAFFLMFDYVALAVVLFNLWFILDCSDGEVARSLPTTSGLGGRLDLMAHLIGHPLYIVAFTLYLAPISGDYIYILAVLYCASDITLRLLSFIPDSLSSEIELNSATEYHISNASKKLYFMRLVLDYPNFLMFATFTLLVDYWLNWNLTAVLFCIYAGGTVLIVWVVKIKKLMRLYMNSQRHKVG